MAKKADVTADTQQTVSATSDEMRENIIEYGKYVIEERAVPDFRDGSKPSQRRLMYALKELGAVHTENFRKCARVTGHAGGLYHPHGDCLRGDTKLYTLDGATPTIKEVYESGVSSLDVLSYDHKTERFVPAKAYAFRVGQHADQVYKIRGTGGLKLDMTGNHPVYVRGSGWVTAENLTPGMVVLTATLSKTAVDTYTHIDAFTGDNTRLSGSFHSVLYPTQNGYVAHHVNHVKSDNRPDNVAVLTRSAHNAHHSLSRDGVLDAANSALNTQAYRDAIKAKNSALMSAYNASQGVRKALRVVAAIFDDGDTPTPETYEKHRSKFYNHPLLARVIERGYTLQRLVAIHKEGGLPLDTSASVGHTHGIVRAKAERSCGNKAPYSPFVGNLGPRMRSFWSCVASGTMLTEQHAATLATLRETGDLDRLAAYGGYVMIDDVSVESVDREPMYDFTVDGYESMFVVGADVENGHNLVLVHNSALYQTLVSLIKQRYALVTGHGNFGSELDPPAAQRYTECKLSKMAQAHFACLDVAEMVSNYSGETTEPLVINTRLPLLLMNGADGIAVGMSTVIPSHNLREICAAIEHVVKNFNTANPASVTALLRGPDFKSGGIMLSKPEDVAAVYGAGRGALDFQCEYRFEKDGAHTNIIVFGFPDPFSIESFIKKCDKMVEERRIKYVETGFEFTPGKRSQDDKRFIIRIGVDNKPAIERVVDMLRCRQTYQFNVTVRKEDSVELRAMNVVSIIKSWIVWRSQEEKKLLELDDKDRRKQLLRETAKLTAAENLKVVFAALQQDAETPEAYLQRVLKLDEDSAKIITDMKVGDLRKANVDVQRKKIEEINKVLAQIADDLAHLPRVIVKNLRALEPFFDERRTRIGARGPQINRVETEGDPFVVAANADGKLFSVDEAGTTSSVLISAGTFDGVAVFGASGVVGMFSVSEMQGKAGTGLDKIVGVAPVEADYFVGVGVNGFGNKIEPTPKSMPCFIKETELLYGGPAWENSTLMLWGQDEDDFKAIPVSDMKTMRKNVKGVKLANFRIVRALLVRADQLLLTKDGSEVSVHSGEGLVKSKLFVVGPRNLVQLKSGRRKFLTLDELRADLAKNDVIMAQDVSLPGH